MRQPHVERGGAVSAAKRTRGHFSWRNVMLLELVAVYRGERNELVSLALGAVGHRVVEEHALATTATQRRVRPIAVFSRSTEIVLRAWPSLTRAHIDGGESPADATRATHSSAHARLPSPELRCRRLTARPPEFCAQRVLVTLAVLLCTGVSALTAQIDFAA